MTGNLQGVPVARSARRQIYFENIQFSDLCVLTDHCIIRGSNLRFNDGLRFNKIRLMNSQLVFPTGTQINGYDWENPKVFSALLVILKSKGVRCALINQELVVSGEGVISKVEMDQGIKNLYQKQMMGAFLLMAGSGAIIAGTQWMALSGGYYYGILGIFLALTAYMTLNALKSADECQKLQISYPSNQSNARACGFRRVLIPQARVENTNGRWAPSYELK